MKAATRQAWALGLFLPLLLAACGGSDDVQPLPTPYPTTEPAERHLHAFDTFWSSLEADYLYIGFSEQNSITLSATARRKIETGLTDAEFEVLLQEVIAQFPETSITYRTRAERIESDLANTLTYEGIGAFVSYLSEPEPHVVLLAVMPDSPAERAGLSSHESIYGVDGIPVTEEEGAAVIQRVRGPSGTVVTLEIHSPDGSAREVDVTRGRLSANDQLSLRYFPNPGVGYLLLPVSVGEELSELIRRALARLEEETVNGLIIDLRVAHSSPAWPLADMLSLFGAGPMGAMYTRTETTPFSVEGLDVMNSQHVPLALLVGADTQGSSEIFAAAMQATGRAIVIGQPSPGNVVNFNQLMLPDGSQVFYAVSSYQTPVGLDLSLSGVQPNIVVDAGWDEVSPEFDSVLDRALEVLAGQG